MLAHLFMLVIVIGGIIGLILYAHFADQRAFERNNVRLSHASCNHVDLLYAAERAEYRKAEPDPVLALGKFVGKLLQRASEDYVA